MTNFKLWHLKNEMLVANFLDLAMDVQQHLLPRRDPAVEGLDIAGKSIYCEETGGDYFDYLEVGKNGQGKIKVVVGDVSDHGIPSALLMTTARAFLRQRAASPGKLNQIVADVNRQIAPDVEESGQFMTLFICEIDSRNGIIRWVNAGHDPALIFDQSKGYLTSCQDTPFHLACRRKRPIRNTSVRFNPARSS